MNGSLTGKGLDLCPSLMCLSPLNVQRDLAVLDKYFATVHVDIMDAHFCESIHLSPSYVDGIRGVWKGKIEAHLMVMDPTVLIPDLALAGADSVIVHVESAPRSLFRLLEAIRSHNMDVGVAFSPETSLELVGRVGSLVERVTLLAVDPGYVGQSLLPSTYGRVGELLHLRNEGRFGFSIQVDGGVRDSNMRELRACGADALVLGRGALFGRAASLADACDVLFQGMGVD